MRHKSLSTICAILSSITSFAASHAAIAANPLMVPLENSNEYFREAPAPDYWMLGSYYVGQLTNSSCSVATAVAVINGARKGQPLEERGPLATHAGILERVADRDWTEAVEPEGSGISLVKMGQVLEVALKAYDVSDRQVAVIRTDENDAATRKKVLAALVANEKSNNDFLVANFDQGIFSGDEAVGHFSTVGAYDAKRSRVLIFDTDKQWFGPYWVSVDTFMEGLTSKRSLSRKRGRGLIWIKPASR